MCRCKPGGDARPCYPSSLSDPVWEVVKPLMPARDQAKGGAPRRYDDRLVLEALADRLPTVGLVRADAGYADKVDSGLLTWACETLKLVVEIVRRSDDAKGFKVLPRRRVVERTFARLARDYERLTDNSEAMVKLAMIRLMATRLAGQSPRWSNRPADQTV